MSYSMPKNNNCDILCHLISCRVKVLSKIALFCCFWASKILPIFLPVQEFLPMVCRYTGGTVNFQNQQPQLASVILPTPTPSVQLVKASNDSNGPGGTTRQGCQMAKFDPFLSLDCARAQSKERKGSNFAAQRSGAIVHQARRAKHLQSKKLAIAIWQQ